MAGEHWAPRALERLCHNLLTCQSSDHTVTPSTLHPWPYFSGRRKGSSDLNKVAQIPQAHKVFHCSQAPI